MNSDIEKMFRTASAQYSEAQLDLAAKSLASLLRLEPRYALAHLLMSSIELRCDRYRSARDAVLAASAQPMLSAAGEFQLFQRLRHFNEHALMVESARRMLTLSPLDIGQQMQVVSGLSGIGAPALAKSLLARMKSLDPRHISTLLTEGYLAISEGDFYRAEQSLEAAVEREPRLAMAHWLLARLRTKSSDSNHVERLKHVMENPTLSKQDRIQLGFSLHKELHDLGEFGAAWDALTAACLSKRQATHYAELETMALFDLIEAMRLEGQSLRGHDDYAIPIFIVGMHRSGTTLLERMLGRHPRIVDCGESYRFTAQLRYAADHGCRGVADARIIEAIAGFDAKEIARGYLESCRWRLRSGSSHFTEKLPSNFLVIGLIKHALPQARILHMCRDPMDVCLSNLRELFSDACGYSYDQGELGRYYQRYQRLMAHWHRCFPGEILDVHYEELVAEPEAVARRVLGYCGLPWHGDVIDLTGNAGAVTTASAIQVRSPIHRRSIGGWRAYEPQLAQLRAIVDA
ncbi:MAG: sulfotransferase [Xanthomonadales bacterium]|nr:sulfotransferase [Xanthomonadales bacterium]